MTELQPGYDVVCIGGALMGSASAYFLSENPDFDGTILVVEPDPSYERASSSLSGNSIREQFSNPVNIRASQFGMDFVADFHERVQVDGESPNLGFRGTGYLFLATEDGMPILRSNHEIQRGEGAGARLLDPVELAAEFPYMSTEGLAGASHGGLREGSLDGWALLQGFRQRALHNDVTYVRDRVVALTTHGGRVEGVELESGRSVACGHVVNAAGPRASLIAAMAGLELPVEPRRRMTFVFDCRTPIEHNVPLTITPQGVHFRREYEHYVTGCTPAIDVPVEPDDFERRDDEFNDIIWPVLAQRVPQFDRISVIASWAGHYAYNTMDHNMVIGPPPGVDNFIFANGFSGHGLQQSPAVGRGVSELIIHGEYRTLDLSELGYDRIVRGEPFLESSII
jgi:glycine/D-amino acid oxidase-like deaminating enzyme